MLFILTEEIKMWPVLMMIQCEARLGARGEVTEPENFPSHFSEQLS